MPDLEQLKQKYQPVVNAIQKEGGTVEALDLQDGKLHLKATVVSEASKNRIWDAIKAVDPTFADLKHEIVARQGDQMYVVQAGRQPFEDQQAFLWRCQPVHEDRQS